jgi:bifunctional UDP-N-acetylglucosamine pyrophosphorylase/glucosamine-1-phosphate N-acetyltransferase
MPSSTSNSALKSSQLICCLGCGKLSTMGGISSNSLSTKPLKQAAFPKVEKILDQKSLPLFGGITADSPVLIVLAAGKGTRFGREPKCIQPVSGTPLARHSIDAFRRVCRSPVICLVGYRHSEVASALGPDNIYVLSDNPAGGTAYAALEAFSVPGLIEKNPLLVITMGDRIIPSSTFRRIIETHRAGSREADITFLTAVYEPPKHHGKGRILRDENGRVVKVIEERDILAQPESPARQAKLDLTEGNCPLYVIRAATFYRHARELTNANAQGQYYLTDVIEAVACNGGDVRTITTTISDPEYDLLCSDVTRPIDLALLEGVLASRKGLLLATELEVEQAANAILAGRPLAQVASIARQLDELLSTIRREKLKFRLDDPVAIGISGGRLRIAFMHPDMVRFYGPAWQMPIGAGRPDGEEQIVMLVQNSGDGRLHLFPINPRYRESINFLPADEDVHYPDDQVSDVHSYERFGTRMSESLLLSLGYFSDEELAARKARNLPLPPPTLWVSNSMRRPFALVNNAIASLRTLRSGTLGAHVQAYLGRGAFQGLRVVSTGNIPQGGFSSSSAVTVATQNAINALYNLDIPVDVLIQLACQAEYGTGVRAGSLDQATEQKGVAGQGALLSSNPRDNYRIIKTYPVPADRIQILFPYSVERDREAWRWSWGFYSSGAGPGPLTTIQMRKMTGKAAEIAAILTHLPLETDFFKQIEDDLVADGELDLESRSWIASVLLRLPLLIRLEELQRRLEEELGWYTEQLVQTEGIDEKAAREKAEMTLRSLFSGWREPVLRRPGPGGDVIEEHGIPLRAMLAYLFGEVAKNFYLTHHPEQWVEYVRLSQLGDRSVEIDPDLLPSREEMEKELAWERGCTGPERMGLWLERYGAVPFDYNRGLENEALASEHPPVFHRLEGSNFFRGLALIDLAEAMLTKAFGKEALAVRVNAAGQGDYFQVHVDKQKADPEDVKRFLRLAFYNRFGLSPEPEFVELHPGGGAVGIRLSRYELLPQLIDRLHTSVMRSSPAE